MGRAWLRALLTSVAIAPAPVLAQSYAVRTTQGAINSIRSSGGVAIAIDSSGNSDDGYGTIAIPFAFPFFGAMISPPATLGVTTNGLLIIGASNLTRAHANVAIPSATFPQSFIAAFWDDLRLNASSGMFWSIEGSPTNRVLVIEWSDAADASNPSETATIQARLHETSGLIELAYGARSGGEVWSGTIGVEDGSGSAGVGYPCVMGTCALTDVPEGTILIFEPSASPPPLLPDLSIDFVAAPPATVLPDSTISLAWRVTNSGTAFSPLTDLSFFLSRSAPVTTADQRWGDSYVDPLIIGATATGSFDLYIPVDFTGTYHLAAIIDSAPNVAESDESNNVYPLGTISVEPTGDVRIITASLPGATAGSSYSAQLEQIGATAPEWGLDRGALPPGLSLSRSGLIAGTPSRAGSYTFFVRASEGTLTPATAGLTIDVAEAGAPLAIATTSLPRATVLVPYSALVSANGGAAPYRFEVVAGAPAWLAIDAGSGAMSGTPSAAGVHAVSVRAIDALGASASAALSLEVVAPGTLVLDPPPSGTIGIAYSAALIGGGRAPYTTVLVAGALPPGLAIDVASGRLEGVPAAAGVFSAEIAAGDSSVPPSSVQGAITVEIVEAQASTLRIASTDAVEVIVQQPVNVMLEAEGGAPPYRWTIAAGALLEGLALDPSGRVDGAAVYAGEATATIAVTDALGDGASKDIVFRARAASGGGPRGGASHRGGCSCSAARGSSGAAASAWVLALLVVISRSRRTRARG